MKITNIEVFTIRPPLAKRYRDNPARNGHEHRVAAKVTTDVGIVGYGDFDGEAPPPIEAFDPLIDTEPVRLHRLQPVPRRRDGDVRHHGQVPGGTGV